MEIKAIHGRLESVAADTVIVNLFSGVTEPGGATGALDRALGGAISELIAQGDLTGKAGEVFALYPRGAIAAKRVLVSGLGDRDAFDVEAARRAAGAAARKARSLGAEVIASVVHGAGVGGLEAEAAAQATAEGMLLGLYRYEAKKQEPGKSQPQQLLLVEADESRLEEVSRGAETARAISAGVSLARDLVNGPSNVVIPEYLAASARAIAEEHAMSVFVGDRAWAEAQEMGAFAAVSQGTAREPQFIVLEHNPGGSDEQPVVLVGKGLTFDTGGISIKPALNMQNMISDMGGAGAVLGTMKAVGELGLARRVIGIAACTENMPDGAAFRPGDVLTASNGKTIEVVNTDAEGRLVLADALVHAAGLKPSAVVNLATLTGACVVALGSDTAAGLFGNDDALRDQLLKAADASSERAWPLPIYPEHSEAIKSRVADMKNSGGRPGGASTAAAFLKEFVSYPWAHLDIAGMALSDKGHAYAAKGASGYGVRLLTSWLRSLPA